MNGKKLIRNSTAEFLIFTGQAGEQSIEARYEDETLWLSQKLMAELFGVDVRTVSEHLKNIFASQELVSEAVIRKFRITASDGKNYQTQFYNLDAIISVGYRVSSARATQFRIWATGVLRQHLVDGYTLNRRRLQERDIEFEQAVNLLARALANRQLVNDEGRAVLRVIGDYARSWSLLQGYDEQSLTGQSVTQRGMRALDLDAGRWQQAHGFIPVSMVPAPESAPAGPAR